MGGMLSVDELRRAHKEKELEIRRRLEEFKETGRDEGAMLKELVFCLLTPQSKAKLCWKAVEELGREGFLKNPDTREIEKKLWGVRFRRQKALYVKEAVEKLGGRIGQLLRQFPSPSVTRRWLVKEVRGMGYKEASHFLRNIGYSFELAILDRHILKNLNRLGVIQEVPSALTPKKYLEIETKMKEFSRRVGIPMGELDLLFWSMETGEVFK